MSFFWDKKSTQELNIITWIPLAWSLHFLIIFTTSFSSAEGTNTPLFSNQWNRMFTIQNTKHHIYVSNISTYIITIKALLLCVLLALNVQHANDATTKYGFPSYRARLSTKTVDKQASSPHTNYTLGREIKSPIQMMDFELMTYTCTERIMMCGVKVIKIMKHIHDNLSLFKVRNFCRWLCIMSMEARMSLSNVSQEYSFCVGTVLGKIALYDGILYIFCGSENHIHLAGKWRSKWLFWRRCSCSNLNCSSIAKQ